MVAQNLSLVKSRDGMGLKVAASNNSLVQIEFYIVLTRDLILREGGEFVGRIMPWHEDCEIIA